MTDQTLVTSRVTPHVKTHSYSAELMVTVRYDVRVTSRFAAQTPYSSLPKDVITSKVSSNLYCERNMSRTKNGYYCPFLNAHHLSLTLSKTQMYQCSKLNVTAVVMYSNVRAMAWPFECISRAAMRHSLVDMGFHGSSGSHASRRLSLYLSYLLKEEIWGADDAHQ